MHNALLFDCKCVRSHELHSACGMGKAAPDKGTPRCRACEPGSFTVRPPTPSSHPLVYRSYLSRWCVCCWQSSTRSVTCKKCDAGFVVVSLLVRSITHVFGTIASCVGSSTLGLSGQTACTMVRNLNHDFSVLTFCFFQCDLGYEAPTEGYPTCDACSVYAAVAQASRRCDVVVVVVVGRILCGRRREGRLCALCARQDLFVHVCNCTMLFVGSMHR
jgi:hypothetical protein